MAFAAKMFGGGKGSSDAGLQARVAQLKSEQDAQRSAAEAEKKRLTDAEAEQKRVRARANRGLLAYTEDGSGLNTRLGG